MISGLRSPRISQRTDGGNQASTQEFTARVGGLPSPRRNRSGRLDSLKEILGVWCGRRDLNPHSPCGKTDFLTRPRLSPPLAVLPRFGVWTIPSPCPDSIPSIRCCPSSLYTFP